MSSELEDDTCRAAFEKWGTELQLMVAMEELAELSVAVSHFVRGRPGAIEELVEELADVELVCVSLRLLVSGAAVDAAKSKKWDRLRRRINEQTPLETQHELRREDDRDGHQEQGGG